MNVLQRAGMECARRAVALEAEIAEAAVSLRDHKARLLYLIGEYDALGGWALSGALSCAHWLAGLCDIELSTAREQVRVARALRELPAVAESVARGVLSYAKARAVTRVATPATEHEVLALAMHASAGALGRVLTNWQSNTAPDQLSERQWAARDCSFRDEADGTVTIAVRVPPEIAARVKAELDSAVLRQPVRDSGEDATTIAQRRADVAVERLCNDAPAGASGATPVFPRVEVVLHRRIDHAEIDGVVLAPATASRLGCDPTIRVMTHQADGSPADVGRRHRLVTKRLRRLVVERDRHCTHPGCESASFLDVHHVIPWEAGGRTDLANLTLLCSFHHRWHHDHNAAHAPAGASAAG